MVYAPLEVLMSKWYGRAEQQLAELFDNCARSKEQALAKRAGTEV